MRAKPPESQRPDGPPLGRDLSVFGLPAREAGLLRDAMARASIVIDPSADEDVVRVPAGGNRSVPIERVLAVVRRWAAARHFSDVPILYGAHVYELDLPDRPERRPARRPPRRKEPTRVS